ncbi:MAG TPA: hypothetical protein VFD82_19550 [Planctomycetota bacterium]|nr:hypothetical protein [Planctomycetota bacterium]
MARCTPVLFLGLAALLPCQQKDASAELAAVRKAPAAEPKYDSKPRYLLIAIGQPIKHAIWCVIDGKLLYVDCDGDGRVDATNERFTPIVSKLNDDHFIAQTHTYKVGALLRVQDAPELELTLKQWNLEYKANADLAEVMEILRANLALRNPTVALKRKGKPEQFAMTEFAESPATATVLHFGAPTTWGVVENIRPFRFTAGQECSFEVSLGTPGLGAWSFVYTRTLERADLRPEIDVAFVTAVEGKTLTGHWELPEWC